MNKPILVIFLYFFAYGYWQEPSNIAYGRNQRILSMTSSIEDETLSYENSEWEGREKIRTKRDGVEEEISSPEYSELESHKQMRVKRDEDSCLRCICERESNCRPLACKWDVNSLSCGYFQIKKEYYKDCGTPGKRSGESIDIAWKRCSLDYDCSVRCIKNYVNRYGSQCRGVGECQKMARLHNGGPAGCRKQATLRYWYGVQNCY